MSGSNFGRSHHIAVVVQHVDALGQLRVSHQAHVTDVRCGFREEKRKLLNNFIHLCERKRIFKSAFQGDFEVLVCSVSIKKWLILTTLLIPNAIKGVESNRIYLLSNPTDSWEWDESLYYGSGGRTQLVGLLNEHVQSNLKSTYTLC